MVSLPFNEAMTSGIMWVACGVLESISDCKVMILLCHILTAIVTDDLISDPKI